ncbi:MAG: hypothetical protein QXJ02_02230 [Candidatus Bathyarchaeia archaeon]
MTRKGAYVIPLETHADGPNRRDKPKKTYHTDEGGFTQTCNTAGAGKTPTPERTQLRGATLRSEVER